MADLVAATNPAKLRGIDFSEVVSTLLPGGGGWGGRPVELRETDAQDLFDVAGWTREMLEPSSVDDPADRLHDELRSASRRPTPSPPSEYERMF